MTCTDEVTHKHPCAVVTILGDFSQMCDARICAYPLKQIVVCATYGHALQSVLDTILTILFTGTVHLLYYQKYANQITEQYWSVVSDSNVLPNGPQSMAVATIKMVQFC